MAKKSKRQPLQEDLPFHLSARARVFLPICDDNPYAAYLLEYCSKAWFKESSNECDSLNSPNTMSYAATRPFIATYFLRTVTLI